MKMIEIEVEQMLLDLGPDAFRTNKVSRRVGVMQIKPIRNLPVPGNVNACGKRPEPANLGLCLPNGAGLTHDAAVDNQVQETEFAAALGQFWRRIH